MNKVKTSILSAGIAVIASTVVAFSNIKPVKKQSNLANSGFAVVELFTSEGCSSCPPADALIAKIQKEYTNQSVYILAYHVDYWDRLGWRDVFSHAAYSARQYAYGKYLKLPQVYTPQIVVNGKIEFVGSEEITLRNAIKTALQQTPPARVTFTNIKADADKVTVRYQAESNGNNSVLLLALVEKRAVSQIKAGENKGRNLSHVQIIRKLQTVILSNGSNGAENIALPKDFNQQNWEVIGLLQNTNTGEIIGAVKSALTPGV
jgi:hypothetical protein